MVYNPFAETPTIYTPEQPWYMGGTGSGGPVLPGPFPAAPVMGQPSPGQMNTPGLPPLPQPNAAMAAPTPTSGNPLGIIGQLLGLGPNRAERAKAAQGQARTAGIQELSDALQTEGAQGIPAQKTINTWMASPAGANFLANSNDPGGEIKQVLGLMGSDPAMAGRSAAFAGGPGVGAAPVVTGADPNTGMEQGLSQVEYLEIARERAAAGDDEGAKIALTAAEEARLAGTAADQSAAATIDEPSIERYLFYVNQEEAGGRIPDRYEDWSLTHTKAGVPNASGGTIPDAVLKRVFDKQDEASKAYNAIQSYQNYAMLSKGIDTNWMNAATLPLQQGLRSIGFTAFNDTVPIQEAMTALSNKFALGARGFSELSGEVGLPGTTSNKDLNFLINSVPNIWNTSAANEAILILMTAQARRQALLASMEAEHLAETGSPSGWMGKDGGLRQELIDTTAFFNDTEMQTLLALNEQAKTLPPRITAAEGDVAPMPDDFLSDVPDVSDEDRAGTWDLMQKNKTRDATPQQPKVRNVYPEPNAPPAPKSPMAKKGDRVKP